MTEFLRQAAAVVGSDSHVLPGHRVVGYNADKWTRLTNALQRVGAVIKYQGKTTTIRSPYDTVGGLYQAVTNGRLRIAPLPAGDMPRKWQTNGEQNRTGAQNDIE